MHTRRRSDFILSPVSSRHQVRRTLELSCEAPIWPGFVSFNSLFDGVVAPRCSSHELHLAARTGCDATLDGAKTAGDVLFRLPED